MGSAFPTLGKLSIPPDYLAAAVCLGGTPFVDTFECARGALTLASDDGDFQKRFRRLFGECLLPSGSPQAALHVRFALQTHADQQASLLTWSHPRPQNPLSLLREICLDREFHQAGSQSGWQLLADRAIGSGAIVAAAQGNSLLFAHQDGWQAVAAQFIVGEWIRLQESVLFFHAATLGIGRLGVMLAGVKGSGKTTLSLTLASRGHSFLSDEFAAICARTRAIFPFRRMASVRSGPQTAQVAEGIRSRDLPEELLADGSPRIRVSVSDLFPDATARPVVLSHVFLLEGFAEAPSTAVLRPGLRETPLLRPLPATMRAAAWGVRVMEILRLLAGVKCYYLTPGGSPDQTADLIERTVEASCP